MSAEACRDDADDEWAVAFPGCVLTHVLSITTADPLDLSLDALLAVKSVGAQVDTLHLSRRPSGHDHRISVSGLRPRQARDLSDRLAAVAGVASIRVEHIITR